MRAGQNTRWEDGTLSEASVKEARRNGLSINQKLSSARAEDHPSATTVIAIVMAGEDRGRGARLFKSSGCSELLLCLMLFRIIQGFGSAGVLGGSCSVCCFWIVSGERDSFAAEGGFSGGVCRFILADSKGYLGSQVINQADSGQLLDGSGIPTVYPSVVPNLLLAAGNILNVTCGFLPAVDYFHLAVHNSWLVMMRPCQRLLSRRGSGRGNPSRPSVGSGSKEQVPDSMRTENVMRLGQFLNPSSPGSTGSPSFGSTTFTFNCALCRPRTTAHVSVLSLEDT